MNASGVECSVESPPVRIGLGYIKGLGEDEARALVQERERGGAYSDLADLASRSGIGRDGLERLAWSGRGRWMPGSGAPRREELWRAGIARGGERARRGAAQLALPSPCRRRPTCARSTRGSGSSPTTRAPASPSASTRWKSCARAGAGMARSEDLLVLADRSPIALAGLVVARQRPATAKGVVFMLLEGRVANVIVPPPVYERCRLAVRTASFRARTRPARVPRGRDQRRRRPDRGACPARSRRRDRAPDRARAGT